MTIEFQEISESVLSSRVEDIFKDIGITSATEDDVIIVAKMELSIFPSELTVSASETRQKAQYSPNSYFASMKLDLSDLKSIVLEAVESAPKGSRVETYIKYKSAFYNLVQTKVRQTSEMLRGTLHAQQRNDGIEPF